RRTHRDGSLRRPRLAGFRQVLGRAAPRGRLRATVQCAPGLDGARSRARIAARSRTRRRRGAAVARRAADGAAGRVPAARPRLRPPAAISKRPSILGRCTNPLSVRNQFLEGAAPSAPGDGWGWAISWCVLDAVHAHPAPPGADGAAPSRAVPPRLDLTQAVDI